MKMNTKPKKYKVELRSVIFIEGHDIHMAYGGLVNLINNLQEKEKGSKYVKKLFKLVEV